MGTTTYYVTGRSIATGRGKTFRKHRLVTAQDMGLTDEQFKGLIKKGAITPGTPPLSAKELERKETEKRDKAAREIALQEQTDKPVLREARILAAIKGMYKEDGTRISDDDFTQSGVPSTDALNIAVLEEGEKDISAAERDTAFELYEKEVKAAITEQ